ncbi:uncharacterized protein LOC118436703 [Folsomia candida]|uniref:uncharacterized protein LOC118436703 n=1 Tax=Folsomia candida TaxID=158441 RepID=UPI00160548CD|nr:uncharacterized protein LOC118436703 [Folsomia candida]XP_035711140.1 uncharacterized protein LOC118436703 [Folsomia candida]
MAFECRQNEYGFPADIFSLGLIICDVAQLIESNKRSTMFDRLVNDKEDSLITLHPQIGGLRELIIALTKKSASDRFQQLEQVQKVFAQKELCDSKEGHLLTARNGEELRKLLKGATPGSKIFLIEAEYDGNFVVEGESITIVGKGEKTVFTNSGSNSFVVKGMGHRILNLKISKSGEHAGFNCLRVEGDMNSFSDLILIGGAYSVKIKGNDNKLDKIQVSVAIKGIHITGSRNTIDDICLTGDTTLFDISVPETTDFFKNLVATFSNIRSNRDCILSEGMYNKFSRVTFQGDFTLGIIFILMRANFNSIENCTNDSFSRLILNIESDNVAASNINCHGINISGNNISLTKATNLERITICSKCGGVELTNCSAMVLAATKNVLLRNSVFGRLERPTI